MDFWFQGWVLGERFQGLKGLRGMGFSALKAPKLIYE